LPRLASNAKAVPAAFRREIADHVEDERARFFSAARMRRIGGGAAVGAAGAAGFAFGYYVLGPAIFDPIFDAINQQDRDAFANDINDFNSHHGNPNPNPAPNPSPNPSDPDGNDDDGNDSITDGEHTKNPNPANLPKHEKGQKRKKVDQDGEKGDQRRPYRRTSPKKKCK
jgi:hypothetical protein